MVQAVIRRQYWIDLIERGWRRRSVVWLHGVRRDGKTTLCKQIDDAIYFDCDLLSVRNRLADPETFLAEVAGSRIVLDEVHRAPDPALILKIAADHFPTTHVVATGSSTLAATARFSDSLAGRKADVWLTPMISEDLVAFSGELERRLWHGGLPEFYLSEIADVDTDIDEWMSAYWARDVQELFRIQQRAPFVRFVELVMARSGGMFEATSFAAACEVSRSTIANYLEVLQVTGVATVIRPFSSRKTTEIVSAPKVYAFDTGFVRYAHGWQEQRSEDLGSLWEHYVLNEVQAHSPGAEVRYWRQKRGPEVDFVMVRRGKQPIAVECKWKSANVGELSGLRSFLSAYPDAEAFVVCSDLDEPHSRKLGEYAVRFGGLSALRTALAE